MVAARAAPRPRVLAVALALILLLPAAALLVPTAEAGHATPTVTLTADPPTSGSSYAKDQNITFRVSISKGTGTCTPSGTPTIEGVVLAADTARRIGHSTGLAFTRGDTDTTWSLTLPVLDPLPGETGFNNQNGGAVFQATATSTCNDETGLVDGDKPGPSNQLGLTVDNVGPTGPVGFSFASSGQYAVTIGAANIADVGSAKADLTAIGGSATQTLSVVSTAQPQPIGLTAPGRVTVELRDPRNVPSTFESPARLADVQVFPVADGKVHVRFNGLGLAPSPSFGFAVKQPGSSVWTVVDTVNHPNSVTDVSSGIAVKDFVLASSLFTLNQPNDIRVYQKSGGSDGVPSDAFRVTPSTTPNAVVLNTIPAAANRGLGVLGGSYTNAPGTTAAVKVAITNRTTPPEYWQNATGGGFGPTATHVTAHAANGAWTTNVLDFLGAEHAKLSAIPDGNYTLLVELHVNGTLAMQRTFNFTLDRAVPPIRSATLIGGVTKVQQGSPIPVRLSVGDNMTNITNVSFQLRASTGARVPAVGGGFVSLECADPACLTTGDYGTSHLLGDASAILANAPVSPSGTAAQTFYQLVALAYDSAGNEALTIVTSSLKITPAVKIKSPALRGDSIHVDVLGAYVSTSSFSPSEGCGSYGNVCKTTEIRLEAKNVGAGASTTVHTLATLVAPKSQMTPEDGRDWWNYTLDGGVGPGNLNRNQPMQMRAVVKVQTAAGAFAEDGETPWLPISTPANPGGIVFHRPTADWKVNTTGSVHVLFTLTAPSPSSDPFVTGEVRRIGTTDVFPVGTLTPFRNSGIHVPRDAYNYTYNTTTLPRGQYAINLSAYTAESSTPLATATRYFAVQDEPPQLHVANVTQPNVHTRTDGWVGPNFVLHAYVDPGVANVSSSGLDFKLQRNVRGTGKTVLNNSEEGFLVQVLNPQDLNPIDKDAVVKLNVTLPPSALDGDTFVLTLQAKSDAEPLPQGSTAPWRNVTSITYGFRLDLSAPTAGVDFVETNITAASPNTELRIIGFARDSGVGVEEVRVRLVNLSSNSTFSWFSGSFVDGNAHGFWATSKVARVRDGYARDVGIFQNFTTSPVHTLYWSVNETNRPKLDALGVDQGTDQPRVPLDRASRYRVDVQVVDRIGRASESSTELGLDPEGPRLLSPLTADPGPFEWHGWGNFSVQVVDNYCVASVQLVARTDTGKDAGPVDFPRPVNSTCGLTTADDPHVWRLDVRNASVMTDHVANYTYWVRATDPSGNVTETPLASRTLVREVVDTQQAIVKFVRLEPPLVSPGLRSRVVAEVFENHAIDKVRVFFHRINPDRTYTLLGEGAARPLTQSANGTGEWAAETDTDLGITNLTLGEYLWEVRAVDKNWEVTCATPGGNISCHQQGIILRVVANAGTQIIQTSPGANASFVNATPLFRFEVHDANVTASGIALRSGNSAANMTLVQPTNVTDLPRVGGQRTGVAVEYRPNLTNQTSISLQLEAASEGGLGSRTGVLTYAVDAIAPEVLANVTGTVDVDNKTYAVPSTRVTLNATDEHGPVLSYSTNGVDYLPYPAAGIVPTGVDGEWRLDYRATDAAGNVARGSLRLHMDRTGPTFNVSKHGDDLLVTVRDAGVGLNESTVKVHYAYGNATAFTPLGLQKSTGDQYRGLLTGNASATGLKYYFEATDRLGNVGRQYTPGNPYVIQPDGPPQNLDPALQITSPPANSAARGKVELRWLASDPEGEDVTITIALRSPTTTGSRFLQTAGPNNGTWVLDVAGYPVGTYTLVVTASDGEKTAQESVNFFVERGDAVEVITPPPTTVESSRLVEFAVRVNPGSRTVQGVTYTLMRGNETVTTGGMKLSGTTYTAGVITGEPGAYAVLVTVQYADGTSEPQQQVATFTVKQATEPEAAGSFPASLITLVVLALATVALAAYAAFVRWPR